MQEYESEEQQIEALKEWWNKNASALFVGLVLGVAGIFGWRYYINTQHSQSEAASGLYYDVAGQINKKNTEPAIEASDRLKTKYQSTPYASLASLLVAKYEYDSSNTKEAIKQLSWVIKNAKSPALQNIARLRLARIQLESKQYDAAEKLLSVKHAAAFDAEFDELQGDIYVAKNDIEKARAAYGKAIAAAGKDVSSMLRLKLQNLGSGGELKSAEPPA